LKIIKNINYQKIAENAVKKYPIQNCKIKYISHNENIIYQIIDNKSSKKYLLKIHYPKFKVFQDCRQDREVIYSELIWLEALCNDTEITFQMPIRSKQDNLVETFFSDELQQEINCSMLSWLEGKQFSRDNDSEETSEKLGILQATLHNHSQGWNFPVSLKRPFLNIELFDKYIEDLKPGIENHLLSSEYYEIFKKIIKMINSSIIHNGKDKKFFGIMHTDMHKGNLLKYKDEIRLIDFSFTKIGNYLFDTAICISNIQPRFFDSFFEGYISLRTLPKNFKEVIEAYFLGSIIGSISFMIHKPDCRDWLNRNLKRIAIDYGLKFLNNESFLFKLKEY